MASLDIPSQILNFLSFYLPLRSHMKSFELSRSSKLEGVLLEEMRKNQEGFVNATKKSFLVCILMIIFTQMTLISSLINVTLGSTTIATFFGQMGFIGFTYCTWFSASSKWSCKQFAVFRKCFCREAQTKKVLPSSPTGDEMHQETTKQDQRTKMSQSEDRRMTKSNHDVSASGKADTKVPLVTRME
eukprot:TRINITY_DN13328_c0_g1_i1.p1 TRINITY_DN13328_c0_g1~~TRINITY_DN13328_c0_g1_i1.p1  ORF type:complete len:187 (+),score=40.99 TRINITY_DN13328_c0_g1_i1:1-561(+)